MIHTNNALSKKFNIPLPVITPTRQLTWHYIVYLMFLAGVLFIGFYVLFQSHWQQFTRDQQHTLDAIQLANDAELFITRLNLTSSHVYVHQHSDFSNPIIWGHQSAMSPAETRWFRRLLFDIRQTDILNKIVRHPNGQSWIFSAQKISDTEIYIILQPTHVLISNMTNSFIIIGAVIMMAALSPYFFWRALQQSIVAPLYELTDISEAIRWRGYLQEDERQRLSNIVEKEYDTRILAQALMAMEEEISNRFFQLSSLLNTSQIVVSSLRTEEVLNNILLEVETLFGCDRCAIVTLDSEAETFRIQASRGLSPYYVEHLNIMPSEPNSPSMRALRNQTPIQIVDTETDLGYKGFRHRSRRENFRSVMSIPLKTTHTPPSVLNLYKDEPYRYSFSERELAISFGNHASLALENATLFQQTDDQVKLQTRRLVSIVESMTEPLILENNQHEITYMNSQAQQLLGVTDNTPKNLEHTFRTLQTLIISREDQDRYRNAYSQSGRHAVDVEIYHDSLGQRDIRVQFFEVRDGENNHLGRGQLWQDISQDKQLDRMKSSLVSTVSHELRTPLATIKGYVTTLLARDVNWDDDTQRNFLETILTETNRLADMVTTILDLSQIESGLIKIRLQMHSLNEIVSLVLPSFPPEIQDRIQVEFDRNIPFIMLDAQRIGTVIRNLIDNALKYAPESSVRVVTVFDDTNIICSVQDDGGGIAEADQEKIFERFYRSETGLTQSSSGFGLGLAICKGFTEAHDGHIWLESGKKGTTVSFSLPIK